MGLELVPGPERLLTALAALGIDIDSLRDPHLM